MHKKCIIKTASALNTKLKQMRGKYATATLGDENHENPKI